MKSIVDNKFFKGTKEITVKIGDNALEYLNQGYKVYVPEELSIDGYTGIVIKCEIDACIYYKLST